MNKTLGLSLVVLALAGVGGVLLATDVGATAPGSCCPMAGRPAPEPACGGCCGGSDKTPTASGTVNDRCPIMGSKIDPAKVPAALTREFKGEKVGFCCGGCPAAWDKLSDADKQTKLDKVRIGK